MDKEEIKEVEKNEEVKERKKGKGKIILIFVLLMLIAVGAFAGVHFATQSANYITTDNARVTTNQITISADVPGLLERFMIYGGRYVHENEVLGWVQNGETLRSPINGVVIDTSAVQGQIVSPMEPLAVIADTSRIHISANIRETDITRLQLGQKAYVTIDGLGNRQFSGYIADIGRITHAELTGSALFFNTGGNFTRVVHLIPVEINIIDDINLDNLIGVNARVRISVR